MTKVDSGKGKLRNVVPKKAKELRNALYSKAIKNSSGSACSSNEFPALEEKLKVYDKICNLKLPGMGFYTRHRHLSWCSAREKGLRETFSSPLEPERTSQEPNPEATLEGTATVSEAQAQALAAIEDFVRAQLAGTPDPTLSALRDWAARSGTQVAVVFEVANRLQLQQLSATVSEEEIVAVPDAPPHAGLPLVDGGSSAAVYDELEAFADAAPPFCQGGTWQGAYDWAHHNSNTALSHSGRRGARSVTPGTYYAGSSTAYSPAGGALDSDWDVAADQDAVAEAAFEVQAGYNWGTPGYADYCTY
ncbi:hypothetical protein C8Q79DRAFT_1011121 [Trametes meyenii]|nr:hypothetical protein C8Q79DRAFT_1011121 [Trametes meyenii]